MKGKILFCGFIMLVLLCAMAVFSADKGASKMKTDTGSGKSTQIKTGPTIELQDTERLPDPSDIERGRELAQPELRDVGPDTSPAGSNIVGPTPPAPPKPDSSDSPTHQVPPPPQPPPPPPESQPAMRQDTQIDTRREAAGVIGDTGMPEEDAAGVIGDSGRR